MKNISVLFLLLFMIGFQFCSEESDNLVESKNHSPAITDLSANPDSLNPGESSVVVCLANDTDGDSLNYTWSFISGSSIGSGAIIEWTAPSATGIFSILCKVDDGNGGSDSSSIAINVFNRLPVISNLSIIPDSVIVDSSALLTCIANDADGDNLIYTWWSSGGLIVGSDSTVQWTAPSDTGTFTIFCKVDDGHGGIDSTSINVKVYQNSVSTVGLVGYWPFNGNANDESGYGNHGAVYGATLAADRLGNINEAYNFDGINDYINIGDVDILRIYDDLTISLWMNVKSFQGVGGIITCITDNSDDPNTNALYTLNFANTNWIHYLHESGPGTNIAHEFANFSFNADVWYYTTLVRKISEKELSLFVDGSLIETYNYSLNPDNGDSSTVRIGENHGTVLLTRFFNGILDEIRIYNRALTEQEIQTIFQSGKR